MLIDYFHSLPPHQSVSCVKNVVSI